MHRAYPDVVNARMARTIRPFVRKSTAVNDVLLAAQPSKQFVTPEQVAAMALFLCRDEAAAITGANLSMDGGWTAA